MEQLQNEINALDSRFKVVRKQIELPNTEQDIKNQMIEFLKVDTAAQDRCLLIILTDDVVVLAGGRKASRWAAKRYSRIGLDEEDVGGFLLRGRQHVQAGRMLSDRSQFLFKVQTGRGGKRAA